MNEWEIQDDESDELEFGKPIPKSHKPRPKKRTKWGIFVESIRDKIPLNWNHEQVRPYMFNPKKMPEQLCLHGGCVDYLKRIWNWDETMSIWVCNSCAYPIHLSYPFVNNTKLNTTQESEEIEDE